MSKKITLRSSDGENFEVEDWVVMEWQTINDMFEVNCAETVIPLPNVTSPILSKVIEYSKKHGEARREKMDDWSSDEELRNWDRDFFQIDDNTIFDLILAANYLNIKSFLDVTCQIVAEKMKHLTPEEIRKMFNLQNTFITKEEEEEHKKLVELLWHSSEPEEETLTNTGMHNRCRHWNGPAIKLLIVFGIVTYIGMYIIRMVWVLCHIWYLY